MPPTTLFTFLVRTPPQTRSVALYGSWDNFSTPYPMQRDSRTGQDHWSGCHSFSNIICDGDLQAGLPRNGALRMGGTYWYYYKLDDDIEFHNPAEPSVTSCPMLPGQMVNVLQVPFAFSGSRSRNDSVSSTNSDLHTLDPSAKFLNPRPVPKLSLPRLKTSPTMSQSSWSSKNSPTSANSTGRGRSATSGRDRTRRLLQLTDNASGYSSRSTSRGSNRSVGIIGAFRTPASPTTSSRGTSVERNGATKTENDALGSLVNPPAEPEGNFLSQPSTDLAFRREGGLNESSNLIALVSFKQHRRERSSSREPSPLRNTRSLQQEQGTIHPQTSILYPRHLEPLKEVSSVSNTPVWPQTAVKFDHQITSGRQTPPNLEKRLPTLPNTPSSAYPPSALDSPSPRFPDDAANFQSHFSCTTIESRLSDRESFHHQQSRFSDWTCDTDFHSPVSDYTTGALDSESTKASPLTEYLNLDSGRPGQIASKRPNSFQDEGRGLGLTKSDIPSSEFSFSTLSSVTSSAINSAHPDHENMTDANFRWSKFQHYSLPDADVGSGVTLKPTVVTENSSPVVIDVHNRPAELRPDSSIPHSETMRQLLDELSYLGSIIQQQ